MPPDQRQRGSHHQLVDVPGLAPRRVGGDAGGPVLDQLVHHEPLLLLTPGGDARVLERPLEPGHPELALRLPLLRHLPQSKHL